MQAQQQEKPTLMQLRQAFNQHFKKNLTAHQIADLAGVPFYVEYLVEIGGHGVYQDEAEKILAAFSKATGWQGTIKDVSICFLPSDNEQRTETWFPSRTLPSCSEERRTGERKAVKDVIAEKEHTCHDQS